ncbi:hypothetical protein ABFA07_015406 [Porites harrisoni]
MLAFGIGTFLYVAVVAREYNRVLIFKEPVEDKILPGHVIRTEKVANEGSCRVKCFLEPNCVSINVGPADDQGQRICELNNLTDESPLQTGLTRKSQATFTIQLRTFVTITHALERTSSVRWASQLNATDVFAAMVLKEKTATKV